MYLKCNIPPRTLNLGGVPAKYSSGGAADLNNYNTYASVGGYTVTSDTANRPAGLNNGVCIVMAREGNRVTQTCLDLQGSAIYRRSYWGSWTDWQQVYDTSLLTNSALLSPLASALGVNGYNKFKEYREHVIEGSSGRYIVITPSSASSFAPTYMSIFALGANFTAKYSRNASRITGCQVKTLIGTPATGWKVFYDDTKIVIQSGESGSGVQTCLLLYSVDANISITRETTYSISGMTEVTIE